MKIDQNDYLDKEHEIKHSIPHVTLMRADGYEQKHVGDMMAESENVTFTPIQENIAIWRSEDQQFLKIMTSAQGVG